ncbi:hypothetical protein [Leptospira licerasiae]|uniref:Uncharacterized protein n=1 Tax=Leptospira licerasiae str. MMD4847 TaxID=1049971 RepID=A0ABN0H9S9_9LEPT|nr:hypothetical protein [Leptospira licerasiae]EJZ42314.1 hypothetical protein LEP1GSC178_0080 [Leptospira licerasiae str. MMD4847]
MSFQLNSIADLENKRATCIAALEVLYNLKKVTPFAFGDSFFF